MCFRGVLPFSQRRKLLEKSKAHAKKDRLSGSSEIVVGAQVRRSSRNLCGFAIKVLSHEGKKLNLTTAGNRTRDLHISKTMLYRVSYKAKLGMAVLFGDLCIFMFSST